ncbi:MAG: glycosyltransferase family 4 protein [bacterium]
MKNIAVLFYDSQALSLSCDPLHPSGGAAKQVLAWSKGLSDIGIKTIIAGDHKDVNFFKDKPGTLITYNPEKGIRILRYLYYRTPRIILSLYRSKASHIYCGIPGHTSGLLAIISKVLRKKFILRISNDYLVDNRYKSNVDWFRYIFYKIGFILSEYIICQNSYQHTVLTKKYPYKTYILSNPYIRCTDNKPAPLEKRKFISWIGIMQYQKNVPLLLEVARSLPDYQFKIAGNISKNINHKDQLAIDELSNMPNVSLLGFISADDVLNLLRKSYILINTSHYEGFSNTFLEAFSTGTPVFTLQQNDPSDIITTHNLGYIYKNTDDFKIAFYKVVQDKSNFNELSSNCIKYMKNNHDLTHQSEKLLDIIGQ